MKENIIVKPKAQYYGIDFLKLFMAVCVISIHAGTLFFCDDLFLKSVHESIIRQAVPFFFISSGFLMFSRLESNLYSSNNINYIKKYILSFAKMYLLWHLIFLPISLHGLIRQGDIDAYKIFCFLANYFFVGEQWMSWPLWYLLSSIYAGVVLFVCIKFKINEKLIYILCVLIYIVTFFLPTLLENGAEQSKLIFYANFLFKNTFIFSRVFRGIVCVPIGMLIARSRISLPKWLSVTLWLFFTGLLILSQSKDNAFLKDVLEIICGSLLVLFALKFNGVPKSSFNLKCRFASSVFYYTHMIWYFLIWCICNYLLDKKAQGLIVFLSIVILSVLTSMVAYKYRKSFIVKKLFG